MTDADDQQLALRELLRLRRVATEVRSELNETAAELDRHEREVDRLRGRLEEQAEEHHAAYSRIRDEREELGATAARLNERRRELEAEAAALRARAERFEREFTRLRSRRLVRLALGLAALFRPLFAVVRALRGGGRTPPPLPVERPQAVDEPVDADERTAAEQRALAALLAEALDPPEGRAGPRVSAIILNRDGEDHLRRLLPALERTAYDDLEVCVVDNGSSDGSLAYLDRVREGGRLRLDIVRNEENASFAAANNQGIAETSGELVLLLNNDIEPVVSTWLAHMVETLDSTGAGAVGARLIYPHRPGLENVGDTVHPDLTLQHRGVHFARSADGVPLPRNLGSGQDPLSAAASATGETPAATAACLLVRRAALETVGGLDEGYVYGTEDVDLCLRLRAAGWAVVVDGQATAWHHEFGTQNREGREFKARNRRHNRRRFVAQWAPRIHREVLLDRLRDQRRWSEDPLLATVIGDAAARLGLDALGWDVATEVTEEADVVIIGEPDLDLRELPRSCATVALVDDDRWVERGWFDDLDVVIASSAELARTVSARSSKVATVMPQTITPAEAVRDALVQWAVAQRISVLISTPDWDVAEVWGDTHYARGLQRWLERAGHPTRIALRRDFDAPWARRSDVAIHLLGLTEHDPAPGQLNVLWNISHPELMHADLVARYDLAFVASRPLAASLDEATPIPVRALAQATDPDRFRPTPGGPHHELLFVANSRRQRRRIVDDLTPTTFDLAIYGGDWYPELVDPRHVRGEVVRNEELPAWYSAAEIVLNDHWPEMLEHGFISNRLYDVLAAGGFVISDSVSGIDEEFDGAVVTYTDRDDLRRTIERFLADPAARQEHAQRGRRAVLERHTFSHRVATIVDSLRPLLDERNPRIAPDSAVRTG